MASVLEESCKLQIKVQTGTSDAGRAITATRTISSVNPDLSNDDAYSVMSKIGALQTYDVTALSRVDTTVLGE